MTSQPVSPQGNFPTSANVDSSASAFPATQFQGLAGLFARTSGNAVHNSMTLLPEDGNSGQTNTSNRKEGESIVPVALVVDFAAEKMPPLADSAEHSGVVGKAAAAQLGNAQHGEMMIAVGMPTRIAIEKTPGKNLDEHNWEKSCTGNTEGEGIENTAPLHPEDLSSTEDLNSTAGATIILAEAPNATTQAVDIARRGAEQGNLVPAVETTGDGSTRRDSTKEEQDIKLVGPSFDYGVGTFNSRDGGADLKLCGIRDEEISQGLPRAVVETNETSTLISIDAGVNNKNKRPPGADAKEEKTREQLGEETRDPASELQTERGGAQTTKISKEGSNLSVVVDQSSEAGMVNASTEDMPAPKMSVTLAGQEKYLMVVPPFLRNSSKPADSEEDGGKHGDIALRGQRKVFFPSRIFTGPKPRYVFKTGDQGLGFYVEGSRCHPTKGKRALSHRPWNAGPGDKAVTRGHMGPVHNPFTGIKTLHKSGGNQLAEKLDKRPLAARMVAQRNPQSFEYSLLVKGHVLRKSNLAFLRKFADPASFKKKHSNNLHRKILGNDEKMIVKSQTRFEFTAKDYRYPEAYNADRNIVPEKGVPRSNDLHQSDDKKKRYRSKTVGHFRAAHDDIMNAVDRKNIALKKMFKKTDPGILQEIAEEAVKSSGVGMYRQKKKTDQGSILEGKKSFGDQPADTPEQLRRKFTQCLKAQIKSKDKALMKDVAAMDTDMAEQMINDFGNGAEVFPGSWKDDPENLKRMQRRRKKLIADRGTNKKKVVFPWRPSGMHTGKKNSWKPFTSGDHRPPSRSASEGKTGMVDPGGSSSQQEDNRSTHGPDCGNEGKGKRPHTAPLNCRKCSMDTLNARAKRTLAEQKPGTPLYSAMSTYRNDPFPLEPANQPSRDPGSSRPGYVDSDPFASYGLQSRAGAHFQVSGSLGEGRRQPARAELADSPMQYPNILCEDSKEVSRSHSNAADSLRCARAPPRRPFTAPRTRIPTINRKISGNASIHESASKHSTRLPVEPIKDQKEKEEGNSLDLHVPSGPGVTVLWARLCEPSDVVCNSAVWPSRPRVPNISRPTQRKARSREYPEIDAASALHISSFEREGKGGSPTPAASASVNAEGSCGENCGQKETEEATQAPLDQLEEDFFLSSWRRVNQRRCVSRGYSERARRARTWDPGSKFFGEGASRHFPVGARPCNRKGVGDGEGSCVSTSNVSGVRSNAARRRRQKRHRGRHVPVNGDHSAEMDWEEVDIQRFGHAANDIKAALEGELFAVVIDDRNGGHLGECFRQAHDLVECAGALLGCPKKVRQRFKQKFGGELRIGNYVATVSRLNLLWTAVCGVIEIVGMSRKRKKLLEVFLQDYRWASQSINSNNCSEKDDNPRQDIVIAQPSINEVLSREGHKRQYEKRLELAEYAIAVVESLKIWLKIVPWRVQVFLGGEQMISKLGIEEEMLPWPPKVGPAPTEIDMQAGGSTVLDREQTSFDSAQYRCTPGNGSEGPTFQDGSMSISVKDQWLFSHGPQQQEADVGASIGSARIAVGGYLASKTRHFRSVRSAADSEDVQLATCNGGEGPVFQDDGMPIQWEDEELIDRVHSNKKRALASTLLPSQKV